MNTIARFGLAVIFAAGLVASMALPSYADGGQQCSLARAAGKWTVSDNGTVIGVGPRTAVGILTLDASGNVLNGLAWSSLNGTAASETFSGTYTVSSDCTGTLSVNIYQSGVLAFTLTLFDSFDDSMREMRGVFTSVTEPNGTVLPTVIYLEAHKQ
jgi:hypothetical protein